MQPEEELGCSDWGCTQLAAVGYQRVRGVCPELCSPLRGVALGAHQHLHVANIIRQHGGSGGKARGRFAVIHKASQKQKQPSSQPLATPVCGHVDQIFQEVQTPLKRKACCFMHGISAELQGAYFKVNLSFEHGERAEELGKQGATAAGPCLGFKPNQRQQSKLGQSWVNHKRWQHFSSS